MVRSNSRTSLACSQILEVEAKHLLANRLLRHQVDHEHHALQQAYLNSARVHPLDTRMQEDPRTVVRHLYKHNPEQMLCTCSALCNDRIEVQLFED